MSFRISRKRKRGIFLTNAAAISLLLDFLVGWSHSSTVFFCYSHKNHPSWSASSSSLWKLSKSSTTTTTSTPPILLGTRADQNRIAAWVPRQVPRVIKSDIPKPSRSLPCAGYYIPSPTTVRRGNRSSALFSKSRDETDNNDGDCDEEKDYYHTDGNNIEKCENVNSTNDIFSMLGNFKYGVNRVNNDFLRLTFKVYSQTFLSMAPFVVLLFIVLPTWSKSSSPTLQLLATQIQGFLVRTFEVLAEGSRVFFVRPMHGLAEFILNRCSTGGVASTGSAWKSRSSRRAMLVWGLFWGPVLEEFIFRFAFRKLWKVLFRPISIGNKNSPSRNPTNLNTQVVEPTNSTLVIPISFVTRILSIFRKTPLPDQGPKPSYTNRSWRIASGICFGIAHFSNFFPIDPSQYTMEGEIRLPSGTVRERFLLSLFPGDFVAQSANQEYCLVSMVLAGAIYQAMHCFINTMVLYGPLLDSPKSKRGGIFAAIGAHIAWNANVLWLFSNLKARVFWRLLSFPLGHKRQGGKKNDSNTAN